MVGMTAGEVRQLESTEALTIQNAIWFALRTLKSLAVQAGEIVSMKSQTIRVDPIHVIESQRIVVKTDMTQQINVNKLAKRMQVFKIVRKYVSMMTLVINNLLVILGMLIM